MTDTPSQTADRFSGFSSTELLRRARVLRDIAETEGARDRRRLERLAWEHEEAARKVLAGSVNAFHPLAHYGWGYSDER